MTIRWALIGTGRHAERSVVPGFKAAEGASLAAVVSRDAARGADFAKRHGIAKAYATAAEALRDPEIDAVYDATPDGLHAEHAIAAAGAGKHVLVEKPLALTVAAGAEAAEACRRRGLLLGVVMNQRHEPAHREAQRLIREGALGDILLAYVQVPLRLSAPPGVRATTWRTDPAMRSGGIAMSIGDHAFDTLATMVGQEIEEVAAFTDAAPSTARNERTAGLLLKLSQGAIGYAATTSKSLFARRPFEIHGSAGTLVIENTFTYLSGAGEDARPSLTQVNELGTMTRHYAPADCFRIEIENFCRAIEGKGAPATTAADGIRMLAICEAIYDAALNHRTVKVADFLPPG